MNCTMYQTERIGMDKNFLTILENIETKTELSQEETAAIGSRGKITDVIKTAYKAGYRDCRKAELHRLEISDLLNSLDYANAQLLMLQLALPEFVEGVNLKVMQYAFYGLYNTYDAIHQELDNLI